MNNTIRTKFYAAFYCAMGVAALGALSAATGVAAAAADEVATKRVRFADLDISQPAGAKVLYQRIQAAAQQVCQIPYRGDLTAITVERRCIDKAIDDAVRTVNAAALTELRFGGDVRLASK
jgi:UrcA family protein